MTDATPVFLADGWMEAALPAREDARICALQKSGILDTAAEQVFDTLVEQAASLLKAPVALITLVDSNRQWFKAKVGTDITETPRNLAFCAHTVVKEDTMVVLDATQDDRFRGNPLVQDNPNIRFYAAAPLVVGNGLVLGTLCVLDFQPREEFTKVHESILEQLAKVASVLIEQRAVQAVAAE